MNKNIRRMIFPAGILTILSINVFGTAELNQTMKMFTVNTDNLSVSAEEDMFTIEEFYELEENRVTLIDEKIAMPPEFTFKKVDMVAYALEKVSLKIEPYDDAEAVDSISKYTEVKLVGQNDLTYWKVEIDGTTYYVNKNEITTDKTIIDEMKEEDRIAEEKRKAEEAKKTQTRNPNWDGSVLTRSKGVNYGPSGKETYYNLPMQGVVNIMRRMGNNDPYWVRDDGCKMLGDYIMVAANLDVHPRGSLVETSLGTAIVCDTGGFAKNNPTQLDIAVNW